MKGIAIASLAGLAAVATAGQSASVFFNADASEVNVGDTINWSVEISFSGFNSGTAYVGGFVGALNANDAALAVSGDWVSNMSGNATTPATGADANVTGVNIFNSALLGQDNPANPLVVATFSTVATAEGILEYSADGIVSIFGSDFIFELPVEFQGSAISGSDRVSIVPTPAAAALLGLGGLATARRRR